MFAPIALVRAAAIGVTAINVYKKIEGSDGIIMLIEGFKQSFEKSKLTGKIIALAISLGIIFPNQTLSLIGFTLGAEAVKSLIHTLYACGAHKIIHEIVLIGGLTSFKTYEHRIEEEKV
jgi:hypothetical protein